MSRTPRPLPAWWPEGEPWPPAAATPRPKPAWWPEGHEWTGPAPPPARAAGAGFIVGVAVLFAIAVNLLGGAALVLARGALGVLPISYAWPIVPLTLLAVTAALFVFAMRAIGSPLTHVVSAAHRVGSGDFSVRVPEQGLPWLRSLAAAFNTMTRRLEQQQQERRALMADIAHELRTPVAVIQGRVEGMLDGVYPVDEPHVRQVLDETRLLARLVEDLRTSAHAESGTLALQCEPTDVAVLVEDVAAACSADARHAHARIETTTASDLPLVELDPQRIREVLLNLLSNALRHSPADSVVTIDCTATPAHLVVRVTDRGPGVPDTDLPFIFDRFYKGSDSTGSGLGLPIARALVQAHGGTMTAVNHPGRGFVVTFALPLTGGHRQRARLTA